MYAEYIGGYRREIAYKQAEKIYDTCMDILVKSEAEGIPSQEAAIALAQKRINDLGKVKLAY